MEFFLPMLKVAAVKFGKLIVSYISVKFLSMLFDALDEVVESVLEKEEKKASETPDKADDRRIAVLRRYFTDWQSFKEKEG